MVASLSMVARLWLRVPPPELSSEMFSEYVIRSGEVEMESTVTVVTPPPGGTNRTTWPGSVSSTSRGPLLLWYS